MKKKDSGTRIRISSRFNRRHARVRTSPRLLGMWRRDLWRNMVMDKKEEDGLLGLVPPLDL